MIRITIKESIRIARPREAVWDFTQDYSKRTTWDRSVLNAQVIDTKPRRIYITGRGGLHTELLYKLDDKPNKTTLVMALTMSPAIEGGGGSWDYKTDGAFTTWTQTNTLILKNKLWIKLFLPLIRRALRAATRRAMRTAKEILEQH